MKRKRISRKPKKPKKAAKFGNKKTTDEFGNVYDSQKEYNRYLELCAAERAGLIRNIDRQVPFDLIPRQMEDGKVIERALKYYADFVYEEKNGDRWRLVVEDVKGVKTDVYKIKRKLMLYLHNIRIREV